jgi:hypothetical protein
VEVRNLRNLRYLPKDFTTNIVKVDRTTKWGNPYVIGKDGNRKEVIAKYRTYLWDRMKDENFRNEMLNELDGSDLACWCTPLDCHAHVLIKAIKWIKDN